MSNNGKRPSPGPTMNYGCDEPSWVLMVAWAILFALLVVVLGGLLGLAALRVGLGG